MQKLMHIVRFLNETKGLDFSHITPVYPPDVWTIPVLIVCYYPVKRGNIDLQVTGDVGSPLPAIQQHVELTTQRVIHALEVGSMFRGYKNPQAQPSLRYQVVDKLEFFEPLPTCKVSAGVPMTDYLAIMERIDVRSWVEERGIKEIWIWGYHGNVVGLWESNMSGPHGDISNSSRDPNDLPLLSKTYTVYHYNYQRGPSEATEDHMHQIEAILKHVDPVLFWEKFVGKPREGRCGWSHFPPNAVRDYDWANRSTVLTDIEDWTPEGSGEKRSLNCQRWRGDSLTWFIYWMQSIPGRNNGLLYQGRPLTNWWRFIGDFDNAITRGIGLYEA